MTRFCGAEIVVRNLKAQGVKYVFGVPGAKIDRVFDALLDSGIETVVCRHEQNASFIAQGLGRMTGKAGVCLVTSGPGTTNLVTGFATATSEGSPVVGFGGVVPRADRLKRLHQGLDTATLLSGVSKYSVEVDSEAAIGEVVANAFRAAESPRPGAAFVALPNDVMNEPATDCVLTPVKPSQDGAASGSAITEAALIINKAMSPVILFGMLASEPKAAAAARKLLAAAPLPVVATFQATGVVPRELVHLFAGRVGLFHNQPGDRLLDAADVVITVGYNPIEYDEVLWNKAQKRPIIHIDAVPCDIDTAYNPAVELTGDIAETLLALAPLLCPKQSALSNPLLTGVVEEMAEFRKRGALENGIPIHPLRIVSELQPLLQDDVTLCLDMGSFHIWHARYLHVFQPRQMLISNGQQTLGVGMPWAIAACLARPGQKVISVSGDGGFHYSSVELETAVRLKCSFVHIIWCDGSYDMVRFQQELKYGRSAGVNFGPVDNVKFAESMGAVGFRIHSPDMIGSILRKAMNIPGPVIIEIPVDYSHNRELGQRLRNETII